MLKDLAKLLLG